MFLEVLKTSRIACKGWNEIYGQEKALGFLERCVERQEIPHALLFTGPQGVGKFTSAFLLAAALLCPSRKPDGCSACGRVARGVHPDLHVVEAEGSFIRIEQIRKLEAELNRKPHEATCKVAIIDNADQMHAESANSFLKTLEEPPPGSYIVLISASKEKLLPTVVSRCREVPFRALGKQDIETFLTGVEGLDAAEAERLARKSGGIFGRALLWARNPGIEENWNKGVGIAASLRRSSLLQLIEEAEGARKGLGEAAVEELEEKMDVDAYIKAVDKRSGERLAKMWEEKEKREAGRLKRQAVIDLFDGMTSFYRDIMLLNLSEEAGEDPSSTLLNLEWREELEREALHIGTAESMRRLQALQKARKALEANVDVGLLLDSLLLELRGEG
jgi:DNA polymerase III subunit delta'